MLPVGTDLRPGRADPGRCCLAGAGDIARAGRLLVAVLPGLLPGARRSEGPGPGTLPGGGGSASRFPLGTDESCGTLSGSGAGRLDSGPRRPQSRPGVASGEPTAK